MAKSFILKTLVGDGWCFQFSGGDEGGPVSPETMLYFSWVSSHSASLSHF
jgi:hypothetical protein